MIAKRAAMVSCNWLLYASSAIDMSAAGYIAIVDGVKTDCALEFVLELLGAYFEAVIV